MTAGEVTLSRPDHSVGFRPRQWRTETLEPTGARSGPDPAGRRRTRMMTPSPTRDWPGPGGRPACCPGQPEHGERPTGRGLGLLTHDRNISWHDHRIMTQKAAASAGGSAGSRTGDSNQWRRRYRAAAGPGRTCEGPGDPAGPVPGRPAAAATTVTALRFAFRGRCGGRVCES